MSEPTVPTLLHLLRLAKQRQETTIDGKLYRFVLNSMKTEGNQTTNELTVYRKDPKRRDPIKIFTLIVDGEDEIKASFSLRNARLEEQDCQELVRAKERLEKFEAKSDQRTAPSSHSTTQQKQNLKGIGRD